MARSRKAAKRQRRVEEPVKAAPKPRETKPAIDFEKGMRAQRDFFAPDGFLLTKDHIQVGKIFKRTMHISLWPRQVPTGWLYPLYNAGDIDTSIHIKPADTKEVVNALTRRVTSLDAQLIVEQKKGDVRYVSELQVQHQDAWTLREQIQSNLNRLFYVTLASTLSAPSREQLDSECLQIENLMAQYGAHARSCFLREDAGYQTVLPLGTNRLPDLFRHLDKDALSSMFPFMNANLAETGGVFLGMNRLTNAPVYFDAFQGPPTLPNPHVFVTGTSGSGKSVLVKSMIARSVPMVKSIIIDPEREYSALADTLGGTVVTLAPDNGTTINPFDIDTDLGDEIQSNHLNEKILELKGLISVMAEGGSGEKLTAEELAVLETALAAEYRERGITDDPNSLYEHKSEAISESRVRSGLYRKQMPTLSSLVHRLHAMFPNMGHLTTILTPFVAGGTMSLFDGQTTVSLNMDDVPVVVFDVSQLEERFMRPLAMQVVMAWIWEKFIKRYPKVAKRVVAEEAWMMMKHDDTARFLELLARRARKRNTSLVIASQSFDEFYRSAIGRAIITNCATKAFLRQAPEIVDEMASLFNLSGGEQNFIKAAAPGETILHAGNIKIALQVVILGVDRQTILRAVGE
jgi:type IV secretory pathway VirB4 component